MLPPLARLARATGICSLLSRDWLVPRAGGMLPPGARVRCVPQCLPEAKKLDLKLVEQPPGQPMYGAMAPYSYRPRGLKGCDNKK
eukprot:4372702-Pyramimonas_sp.AAC.1